MFYQFSRVLSPEDNPIALFCIYIDVITAHIYEDSLRDSYYAVEFNVLDFVNSNGRLLNGNCCSGYKSSGLCRGGNATCRPYWKICISEQQNKISTIIMPKERREEQLSTKKPSIFRNIINRIFWTSSTTSPNDSKKAGTGKTLTNTSSSNSCSIAFWMTDIITNNSLPIKLKTIISSHKLFNNSADELKSKQLLVLIEVWHKQKPDTNDKLVTRYIETKNISIDSNSIDGSDWNYNGKSSSISSASSGGGGGGYLQKRNNSTNVQFSFRWRITPTYEIFMNETRDESRCPVGWKGDNCDEPICMESCHPSHGYCEQPGKCQCKFGWTGLNCDYCMTIPGCAHGYCTKPLECRCEEGWTGMFCNAPKCKDGCDQKNGYCSVPGECKCRFGWEGDNCTQCSTLPGCQHGSCHEPLDCNCNDGWEGMFCSTPICSVGCDKQQGWCRRPKECRCKIGWTGSNCTDCVPYPGCDQGSCNTNPWTCDCKPGWGGITCSERLDWCELNPNPCTNSGTCINVEKAEGSYLCKCVVGYTGRHCEQLAN
ncbi:delta-like protein 1 [Oppia nitens]|uniref:delta-like protein 1 n=1 Tax=Oppia nitens TaxID=1686743 RepID=UPI0023D98BFB|nr:delta-like protein 1 [Oppia nitens]